MSIKLMHGDCLERMKEIPDGSVDMVLTDPPYGTTACKWDSVIDSKSMWEQLKRIIKPNGAVVLFGSEPFASTLRMSNIRNYKYDLYWVKEKPTNFMHVKRRFGKLTEVICVFYKTQCTYNPQKYKSNKPKVTNSPKGSHESIVSANSGVKVTKYNDDGTRYPCDILNFNRVKLGTTVHPTQKPVALMEYLVKTYTNEGETVLDFTMGSGTTGVACVNIDRSFIGIELDKEYYKLAKDRIVESKRVNYE